MKIWFTRKRMIILGFIGLAWAGLFVDIYKDVGQHCDFTGSKRGWREYPLGFRSPEFHETSPLETFIKENHPSEFEHSWVSYQGTARNWYGLGTSRGHGRPNALISAGMGFLEIFVRDSSPQEVKEFYDFLRTNDLTEQEVDEEIWKIVIQTMHPSDPPP